MTSHISPFITASTKEEIANGNVAMYFNMASMSPPIELHAAFVRYLLSRGNRITVYILGSSFVSPTENPFNRRSIRMFSEFRAKDAIKGLPVKLKVIELAPFSVEVDEKVAETLELGVMSSLASATKAQTKEQLNTAWKKVYDNMYVSARKLYNYFLREIEQEQYDAVFMFNGRFGCVKPVLEAARNSNTAFGLVEVKKTINEVVFINELVHSIDGNTRRAFQFYEMDPAAAVVRAERFFTKKKKNESTGDPIFTKSQEQGSLPEEVIATDKKVIAVYPTTEDEYKFIGKEWDGYVPESQVDEIEKLAMALPMDEFLIVVKMHPNQATTAENTQERYREIAAKYAHVVVENPFSKKDSYALMERADVVVTFASTIGVEACYAGKPVVLIGDTTWSNMNVAYKVRSGNEAAGWIKSGPTPFSNHGAIVWGNYLLSYKDALPGYEMAGNGDYFVDGKRIGKSTWRRILQLPAKLEIETSKPGFTFGAAFVKRIKGVAMNILRGKWAIN